MDVEGAEFESLARIPDPVLARFEQIVVEVHWLEQLINPNYRAYFCHIFRKLNSIFTLHHVHANNFDGPDALPVIGGFPVARIIELSYIRTSVVTRRRSATVFPTPMDFPNSGTRDKLLWIFPFFPSAVPPEALSRCAERVESTETRRS
jgi:hypothetical protein